MADNVLDRLWLWVRSLWNAENELRRAARSAVLMRKEEARDHLSAAQGHLDEVRNRKKDTASATIIESPSPDGGPTPIRPDEMPLRNKPDVT